MSYMPHIDSLRPLFIARSSSIDERYAGFILVGFRHFIIMH